MTVTEYIILFALVAIMGAGLPGPGDASLIAAGTLAGEGRVYVGTVLVVSGVAWMLGSLAGYALGIHKGARCSIIQAGGRRPVCGCSIRGIARLPGIPSAHR